MSIENPPVEHVADMSNVIPFPKKFNVSQHVQLIPKKPEALLDSEITLKIERLRKKALECLIANGVETASRLTEAEERKVSYLEETYESVDVRGLYKVIKEGQEGGLEDSRIFTDIKDGIVSQIRQQPDNYNHEDVIVLSSLYDRQELKFQLEYSDDNASEDAYC